MIQCSDIFWLGCFLLNCMHHLYHPNTNHCYNDKIRFFYLSFFFIFSSFLFLLPPVIKCFICLCFFTEVLFLCCKLIVLYMCIYLWVLNYFSSGYYFSNTLIKKFTLWPSLESVSKQYLFFLLLFRMIVYFQSLVITYKSQISWNWKLENCHWDF